MRQVDRPEPFQPLGHPEPKKTEPTPEWKPTQTPGIEVNSQGQLRTNRPQADPCRPFTVPGTWGTKK